ncbi:MAG TPA: hypothetical protein VFP83_07530 [Candidatus Limnocylindria bacterium]|nr:hypothetical protein [Candidatus Limnocylindria bacterium]
MPELKPNVYEHQEPRRPMRLPRRLTPPPEHPAPPNLKVFAWVGLGLGIVVLVLALPYLVSYFLALAGM